MPERTFISTGDRTRNHQVMSPTRTPLSHPGSAQVLVTGRKINSETGLKPARSNCLVFTFCRVREFFASKHFYPLNFLSTLSQTTYFSLFQVNPFPNKPWFSRVCSTSLLKTLCEQEKLLVISNFSFSHSVFNLFTELYAISIKFQIVLCKLFNLWESKICRLRKG